jgi:hypothetical protein
MISRARSPRRARSSKTARSRRPTPVLRSQGRDLSIKEPLKLSLVLSPDEVKCILAMAPSFKARVMLTIAYGCGLRANVPS